MATNPFSTASSSARPLSQDTALPADAEDTISSVSWSPASNHLAAASWDGKVRIYDVAHNGSAANGVALLSADGPVFDCDWAKDGTMVLAGGADRKAHLLHAATGQQTTVGAHDAPIRGARFVDVAGSSGAAPIIATGSWDKTVRLWDLRQPEPLASLACMERVYAMDAKARLLVVATAERHLHLVDLQKDPSAFLRTAESPLRHQTKAVTVFPDGGGWGTVSIEGRCAINALDEKDSRSTDFTFRCHRGQPDARSSRVTKIWAVNDVQFHPTAPTIFTTAGSDGVYNFWDRVARSRLKSHPPPARRDADAAAAAITSTRFNRDGSLFAYAVGYDWSMGFAKNTPDVKTKLMLHRVTEEESRVGKSVKFR